ncbi:hypothetical protein THF5H11_20828 [Vibrio jasicida]|nr:hypothetical protein THF5H11_20828 [Vibrio jasicida]
MLRKISKTSRIWLVFLFLTINELVFTYSNQKGIGNLWLYG